MSLTIARPLSRQTLAVDLRLERALRSVTVLGAVLALFLPLHSHWLGWTPLWLVLMPASAWWALHRFRLPLPAKGRPAQRRRRPGMQARRRKSLNMRALARAA